MMKQKFFFTVLTSLFMTFGLLAQTDDYYVSSSGDDTDGLTLATAFTTVNGAINAATAGDNIIISGSVTDTQKTNIDKNLTFTGQSSASVTQTATGNLFDVNTAVTITFTDITFDGITNTGAGGVLNVGGAAANVTFTNCILSNNSAAGGNGGGAIFIGNSATVNLNNCVLKDNSATGGGAGAVAVNGSGTLNVTGSTFYNNSCTGQGGAIRMISTASCTISNSTFFNNSTSTPSTPTPPGGAIRANSNNNTITITNSLFYNNLDGNNTAADISASSGATASIKNTLAQYETNFSATDSNATADLTNSNLTWNASENRVEFTAPDAISDVTSENTPIDFGIDSDNGNAIIDVGAWDSKINIFEGKSAGPFDEAWITPANWSSGALPTATDNVAILTGGACTLNTNATINDIKVTGRLDIANNQSLIVNGTATTGSGSVNYLRQITNNADLTAAWHLVSSPLSDEVFDATYVTTYDIAANGTNRGIATYTTSNDTWSYYNTDNNTSIPATSGKGFSMKITPDGNSTGDERADNVVAFQGNFNTNDAGVTTASLSTGFNLVGNPYTSFINSATFLDDNANIDQTQIWVWNATSGAYEVKIVGDSFVLAPAQGFFVNVTTAGTLNFAEANQATTGASFLKSSRTEAKLIMSDGTNNRYAKIYFTNTASKGFDFGWEGEVFGGIPNSLNVFTHLVAENQGKKYQVQSLPLSEMETTIIPVGVIADAGKEITFTAEAMNLPNDIKVYLEDRLNNTFIGLDETSSSYKVTLNDAINGVGRFYLHTKTTSVLSTTDVTLENVSVFTTNNNTLKVVGLPSGNANLKLYNILGKQVMQSVFTSSGVKEISLPKLATGVYLIQLETIVGKLNKKVILE